MFEAHSPIPLYNKNDTWIFLSLITRLKTAYPEKFHDIQPINWLDKKNTKLENNNTLQEIATLNLIHSLVYGSRVNLTCMNLTSTFNGKLSIFELVSLSFHTTGIIAQKGGNPHSKTDN